MGIGQYLYLCAHQIVEPHSNCGFLHDKTGCQKKTGHRRYGCSVHCSVQTVKATSSKLQVFDILKIAQQ